MVSTSKAAPVRKSHGTATTAGSFQRILLATEGRGFSEAVIAKAEELLAASPQARIHVFSIARVYGSGFGLPNPGLLPTKAEWEWQRKSVATALRRLRRNGVKADGRVIGTRKGMQRICKEAAKEGCEAIVMGADPDRSRLLAPFMWSQEPQRVSRRAKIPVYLVTSD
jgi:nucleotide-binding universal stress UspA family protein